MYPAAVARVPAFRPFVNDRSWAGARLPLRSTFAVRIPIMRATLPSILLAAVLAGCAGNDRPAQQVRAEVKARQPFAGWRDVAGGKMSPDGLFHSETGQFFAAFPGLPVHEAHDVETQAGRVRMDTYVYEESVTMAYMVAYSNYPTAFVNEVGAEAFLDRAEAGALKAIGITGAPTTEKIGINGYPGVKYRANSDGRHIVSQLLLAGNRLFQITILSDGAYPSDGIIQQFFDGFHFSPDGTQTFKEWELNGAADSAAQR